MKGQGQGRGRSTLPLLPKRVSGPVSVHVFGERFIVLGDAHFSKSNQCKQCKKGYPACEHVVDMLERFVEVSKERGVPLDVHVELPYISTDTRSGVIDMIQSATIEGKESGGMDAVHRAVNARDIGTLGILYHRFKQYLYDDERKRSGAAAAAATRFHYSDIRHEPNVAGLYRLLRDDTDVMRVLGALLLDRQPADAAVADMPFMMHRASLSRFNDRTVHKVTKQYLKLVEQGIVDMGLVESYIEDRIYDVCDALRIHQRVIGLDRTGEEEIFTSTIPFIIMDAYVLYRALYYAAQHEDSITVVYVGGLHAESIVNYFINYTHTFPDVCHQMKRASGGDHMDRCVHTTKECI